MLKPYRNDRIRSAMAAHEPPLTTEQLADLSKQSRTTISKITNGSPFIRLISLIAVADALGLSMRELFTPREEQSRVEEPAAA